MKKEATNILLVVIILLIIVIFVFIICVLGVSFFNESQGKYIEIWARDYSSLISALGILLASSLAAVSVQRTIDNSIETEKNKKSETTKKEISDIMKILINLSMTLKYYEDFFSKNDIYENKTEIKADALVIFDEINDLVSSELNLLATITTPIYMDEEKLHTLIEVIFVVENNLRKIKITTRVVHTDRFISKTDLVTLTALMKDTTLKIETLAKKN